MAVWRLSKPQVKLIFSFTRSHCDYFFFNLEGKLLEENEPERTQVIEPSIKKKALGCQPMRSK
jgi:hypothetical protein